MSSTENIFRLTKSSPMSFLDIWFSHQFIIVFFLIFTIISVGFFWFKNFRLNKFIPVLFFTSSIFVISFQLTAIFCGRHPMNFKEFLIYTPQYNVQYSHMVFSNGIVDSIDADSKTVKKEDFNIVFFPDDLGDELHEKNYKLDNFDANSLLITYLNTKNLKKIFYNEKSFKDHLSSQEVQVCSLYFFVDKGTGELAKDDYVSISWMSQTLILGCEGTVNEIVKQIVERHPTKSYSPIKTDSSMFSHEYPSNNPESVVDNEDNSEDTHSEDEHNHNHNHHKEIDKNNGESGSNFHYSI